ncbi:Ribosomal RNA large subunit methyltransferase H [Madurella mycetomatis]|uniref:Ribosomal RNA large subunit methyltransferase H n=1 Tax=Madurella mycetomatis TaxID=100816 RepID=A0A175W6P6_9PEZI|nr:Ribosomal RNA large subunit methyltransferase H [Madurella mycetomatis]KXX80009.1 Ribosomal RNA large subunit methyltransferase H [Madurella mycetomatis]
MEGHITTLSPFLSPKSPTPLDLQSRRAIRHGFLSNRWGLYRSASASLSSASRQTYPKVVRGWSGLPLPRKRRPVEIAIDTTLVQEIQSKLGDNNGELRGDLYRLWHSVQGLTNKLDELLDEVVVSIDQFPERHANNSRVADHNHMEKTHGLEKARLKLGHRIQVDNLVKNMATDMERLQQLEQELEAANMRAEAAAGELAKTREEMDAQARLIRKDTVILTDRERVIKTAFQTLRASILEFSMSSAVQLGPLPDATGKTNNLCHSDIWNRASTRQRSFRVMAKIFQLLFRRILRPGLRAFGLQAILRSEERHDVPEPETRLRALEEELETHNVSNRALSSWIGATIDAAAPLINPERIVDGVADEIFEALSPVIRFAFTRNLDKVKGGVSVICQEAVRLKLAMRGTPGNYKIEVPSRDTETWGEPGCDNEMRALESGLWLQVIEHEVNPDTERKNGVVYSKRASGDIACIPFGALTKLEEGQAGTARKVILEKSWVVSKRVAGERKRKTEPSPVLDEQPAKRANPSRGISPANLARIKALMDAE